MHEYPKGHPMWRRPQYSLLPAERDLLISATSMGLKRQLGKGHEQIAAFRDQVPQLNDDRIVSVALANGDPEVVGPLVEAIRLRLKREHRRANRGNR